MYLKRLEVIGFKSFADKTELEFGPGITAIVGPNGSGKSNVSDAIRWVLGEQSAKALRGGAMQDVIFAGSDGKKAMGFAQVSLILDNSDGKLAIGYNEVMVTRRVDRSGEGEYFINQVPCRLKDVQDLFLDTGVGKDNYSIIGQGKIDEILSTKPEDRRALFEEAAGISRYKSRKREAQRRLEETEQNLLRITDIIGELSTQMASLSEQAEKTRIYNGLQSELTTLEIGLLAHGLEAAAARLIQRQAENERLAEKLQGVEAKLGENDQAAQVTRTLAESLDQELNLLSLAVTEATGLLERVEGRLALARQEQKVAGGEEERLTRELEQLQSKLSGVGAEAATLAAELLRLQQETGTVAADLSAREQELSTAQAEVAQASLAVEARKNQGIALLQEEADRKNRAAAAERTLTEAQKRQERLAGERSKAEAEATASGAAEADLAEKMAVLRTERDEADGRLSELRTAYRDGQNRQQELQQRGSHLREQLQGASSRLGAIEEMMNAFDGYQKGTRTVLVGREKAQPWAQDVLGAVAELIRTEPKYEKAIEVALGGNIQNIVTATDQGAKAAIEHLKKSQGGRATFLPLNVIRPNSFRADEEREFKAAPGIIGVALDLIRFDEQFRPAMASLLGRVLIADDMDAALAFGRKSGMRYRIVTLDGEVLAAGGALTGGSVGGQSAGLLSREREREELTARIQSLREEIAAARKAYEDSQAELTRLQEQIRTAEQEVRGLETRLTQSEGEAKRLAAETRRWHDLLQTFGTEDDSLVGEVTAATAAMEQFQAEVSRVALERSALEAEVVRLTAEGQSRVADLEARNQALTGIRVRLAELNQQVRGLEGQQARLAADQAQLAADRDAKAEARADAQSRLAQAALDEEAARGEVADATVAKQAAEEALTKLQARKLETLEQINNLEREARNLRRSQSDTQGRLQQGEVEEARIRMEQEGLVARLAEQHNLTPADVVGRALAEEQLEFARARTQALREEIRELGAVNLAAIEEYQNTVERFDFLSQQRTDLEEAKGSLYRAVEELDKRIKTHFLASFGEIRREFQRVYSELFEGGRADLQLVDENDLLETGIEIIARPPGKKPQTLSLLSGGERAMTAVALLFAFLRVKPTPFVVMDEVEAALDEANVERFGKYLRIFSNEGCQFICISHQRGTMEVADALYGVTMEGTGVSKVVSVRLVDIEREAS
ncbi:MAG: chromosome segregation protein SMC [Mycobacterium leprae]